MSLSTSNMSTTTATTVSESSVREVLRQLMRLARKHAQKQGHHFTPQQLEAELLHLEMTDPDFHRYEIVREIKKRICSMLEQQMDRPSPGLGEEEFQDNVVQEVVHRIMESEELGLYVDELTGAVEQSLKSLTIEDIIDVDMDKHKPPSRVSSLSHYDDEDYDFDGPLFGLMPPIDEVRHYLVLFEPGCLIEQKLEGLRSLSRLPAHDLIVSEVWPSVRRAFRLCLSDNDERVFGDGLLLNVRMFHSESPHVTREVFLHFAEYTKSVLETAIASFPVPHSVTLETSRRVLSLFSVFHQFVTSLPSHWVRFGERGINDVVQAAMSVFDVPHKESLGTEAFFALFEPSAAWFQRWCGGQFSRRFVFDYLENHPHMLDRWLARALLFSTQISHLSVPSRRDTLIPGPHGVALSSELLLPADEDTLFSSSQLAYLSSYYCVSLMKTVVAYSNGRDLFPRTIKQHSSETPAEEISLEGFLLKMIQGLHSTHLPPRLFAAKYQEDHAHQLDPRRVVVDLIKRLAGDNIECREVLCTPALLIAIVEPISALFSPQGALLMLEVDRVDMVLLVELADVLACLVSVKKGRKEVLAKRDISELRGASSILLLILRFINAMLSSLREKLEFSPFPLALLKYNLSITRQIYSTCEGLDAVSKSDFCSKLSETISFCIEKEKSWHDAAHLKFLLIDNLLNFASAPKGLLVLLQDAGEHSALCVDYMLMRYKNKLQVSKYEKFGYGYMLVQMASTIPGISLLQRAGFLSHFLSDLTMVLETRSPQSMSSKIEKSLSYLIKVLSSYEAIWYLLKSKDADVDTRSSGSLLRDVAVLSSGVFSSAFLLRGVSPPVSSTPEIGIHSSIGRHPTSGHGSSVLTSFRRLGDFIDRLVIINSSEKMSKLLNFEEEHRAGLELLFVLTSCLDTCVLLQEHFSFQNELLALQKECLTETEKSSDVSSTSTHTSISIPHNSNYIIDRHSLLRHRILVRSYFAGGGREVALPPTSIAIREAETSSLNFFHSPPRDELHCIDVFQDGGSEFPRAWVLASVERLAKDVSAISPSEMPSFMDDVRSAFIDAFAECNSEGTNPWAYSKELCRRATPLICKSIEEQIRFIPNTSTKEFEIPLVPQSDADGFLSASDRIALEIAINYGFRMGVCDDRTLLKSNLVVLISSLNRHFTSHHEHEPNHVLFDWFAVTLFFITQNVHTTLRMLENVGRMPLSSLFWFFQGTTRCKHGLHTMSYSLAHTIESIVQIELPLLHNLFRISGFPCSLICLSWLRQCFWNFLDWPQIVQYMICCLVLGSDFHVYYVVALLRFMEPHLRLGIQQGNIVTFLKTVPISGFDASEHIAFMQELREKYRPFVMGSAT